MGSAMLSWGFIPHRERSGVPRVTAAWAHLQPINGPCLAVDHSLTPRRTVAGLWRSCVGEIRKGRRGQGVAQHLLTSLSHSPNTLSAIPPVYGPLQRATRRAPPSSFPSLCSCSQAGPAGRRERGPMAPLMSLPSVLPNSPSSHLAS